MTSSRIACPYHVLRGTVLYFHRCGISLPPANTSHCSNTVPWHSLSLATPRAHALHSHTFNIVGILGSDLETQTNHSSTTPSFSHGKATFCTITSVRSALFATYGRSYLYIVASPNLGAKLHRFLCQHQYRPFQMKNYFPASSNSLSDGLQSPPGRKLRFLTGFLRSYSVRKFCKMSRNLTEGAKPYPVLCKSMFLG